MGNDNHTILSTMESSDIPLSDLSDLPRILTAHKKAQESNPDLPDPLIRVHAWVLHARKQKRIIFMNLRDGGFVQVMYKLKPSNPRYAAQHLAIKPEAAVEVVGTLKEDERAPEGYEIHATDVTVIKPSESIDSINKETGTYHKLNYRHLVIREQRMVQVLKARAVITELLREFFKGERLWEVTPPTITQQSVEGGSTLFKFDYYGMQATLTQSSQLYLEACIPSLKRVYTILPSFRSEKSKTIRHLSEFTHCEAELAFISFEDLLQFIERMVRHVVRSVLEHPETARFVEEVHPELACFDQDFMRLRYADAIKFCQEHGITKSDGAEFVYGDDIPDAPERAMVNMIGRPVLLTHFPADMKSFYMSRDPENTEETLSVDLLLPGVGETVGGSMRIDDTEELLAAFKREGIPTKSYEWYIDQRRYGSTPHGGFGLGIERLIMAICKQDSVRECCLFPRYVGRLLP